MSISDYTINLKIIKLDHLYYLFRHFIICILIFVSILVQLWTHTYSSTEKSTVLFPLISQLHSSFTDVKVVLGTPPLWLLSKEQIFPPHMLDLLVRVLLLSFSPPLSFFPSLKQWRNTECWHWSSHIFYLQGFPLKTYSSVEHGPTWNSTSPLVLKIRPAST